MSPQGSIEQSRGVLVHRPRSDIYTVLLGIALAAILLAVAFLAVELARYDWDYQATGAGAVAFLGSPAESIVLAEDDMVPADNSIAGAVRSALA